MSKSRPQRSKELMKRVRDIVLGHHEGDVMEISPTDAQVLMMYSRIRSLLEGVGVLLNARLPAEAIILGREMFADSVRLMAIASKGAERGALILGMIHETLTDMENLERDALSLGLRKQEHFQRVTERIAERRRQIESYRRRQGIGERERFGSVRQLAKNHGRLEEYLDFELAHRFVHRAEIAQTTRTLKQGDVLGLHLRSPDDDFIAAVAAFAMTSALHAHAATASIFGWTETPIGDIDLLLTEIQDLFSSENPDSGAL